ncbi:hypothetical protein LuPra_03896 [Luteitalea pratensis]|uniref:DUF1554 domain-containing protein n=1 Tax=Luteitalea pratensis TaxID=1855912 RepID=A0A143PPM5_LUTPR|nr:hypothetical protein [Luteitalea pratensis]AMY10657.1 hypothetical protein LuPra_03896 [Luteitalea pratensis]
MEKTVFKTLAVAGALLAFSAVATLFTAPGIVAQSQTSVGNPALLTEVEQLRAQLAAIESSVAGLKPRRFYLTQEDTFDGATVLGACATGFHMASIFEVSEPSTLRYDTELGYRNVDSGSGPPIHRGGWIRTGRDTTPGFPAHCTVWTNNSPANVGTSAMLRFESRLVPWESKLEFCNQAGRVWCVQD